jgi:hypothetical protein
MPPGRQYPPYPHDVRLEAERMFLAGAGPGEVARALKIRSRSTVFRWAEAGGWEARREQARARASQMQVRRAADNIAGRNDRFRRFFETVATSAFSDLFERDEQGNIVMGPDGAPKMRHYKEAIDAVRAIVLAHVQIRLIDGQATERQEFLLPMIEIVRGMAPEDRQAMGNEWIRRLDSANAEAEE